RSGFQYNPAAPHRVERMWGAGRVVRSREGVLGGAGGGWAASAVNPAAFARGPPGCARGKECSAGFTAASALNPAAHARDPAAFARDKECFARFKEAPALDKGCFAGDKECSARDKEASALDKECSALYSAIVARPAREPAAGSAPAAGSPTPA